MLVNYCANQATLCNYCHTIKSLLCAIITITMEATSLDKPSDEHYYALLYLYLNQTYSESLEVRLSSCFLTQEQQLETLWKHS